MRKIVFEFNMYTNNDFNYNKELFESTNLKYSEYTKGNTDTLLDIRRIYDDTQLNQLIDLLKKFMDSINTSKKQVKETIRKFISNIILVTESLQDNIKNLNQLELGTYNSDGLYGNQELEYSIKLVDMSK